MHRPSRSPLRREGALVIALVAPVEAWVTKPWGIWARGRPRIPIGPQRWQWRRSSSPSGSPRTEVKSLWPPAKPGLAGPDLPRTAVEQAHKLSHQRRGTTASKAAKAIQMSYKGISATSGSEGYGFSP
jgi:hypothetical protein